MTEKCKYWMPATGNDKYYASGQCNGTRWNDPCKCEGDKSKCDFYKEKKLPEPMNGCDDCKHKEPYRSTLCGIKVKMAFCDKCGRLLFGGWEE
jgi:hypothetical protein